MKAEGDFELATSQGSPDKQGSTWLRLVSSPVTSPKMLLPPSPVKSKAEAIDIPKPAPSVPASNASSAGSYEASTDAVVGKENVEISTTPAATEDEDPWAAYRDQLKQSLAQAHEAGEDEIVAFSFSNDMEKRLNDGQW